MKSKSKLQKGITTYSDSKTTNFLFLVAWYLGVHILAFIGLVFLIHQFIQDGQV